jgi:hypothetical protein
MADDKVAEIRAELEDIARELLGHAAIASRAGQSSQLERLAVRVKGLKLQVSALGRKA